MRGRAKETGLTRSNLSRRLSALEQRVGAQLAKRSPQGFALTPAGQAYFDACVAGIDRIRDAEAALSRDHRHPRGLVRITAPSPIAHAFLASELFAFLAKYVEVSVLLDVTSKKTDLRHEPFDLALRVGDPGNQDQIARRIFEECEGLYAAPDWLKARSAVSSPRDLAGCEAVNCSSVSESGCRAWHLTDGHDEIRIELNSRLAVNDAITAREAVINGVGIGNLPRFIGDPAVAAGHLVRILPDWTSPRVIIRAILPHKPTAAARALLDHLVARANVMWPAYAQRHQNSR